MLAKKLQLGVAAHTVSDIPPGVSIHTVEWLLQLQSRDAFEATRKALQHWLKLDRAWQYIEAKIGRLKKRAFPKFQFLALRFRSPESPVVLLLHHTRYRRRVERRLKITA